MKIILDYKKNIPQNYDLDFFLYNSVLITSGTVHDTLVMQILFNFIKICFNSGLFNKFYIIYIFII